MYLKVQYVSVFWYIKIYLHHVSVVSQLFYGAVETAGWYQPIRGEQALSLFCDWLIKIQQISGKKFRELKLRVGETWLRVVTALL